MRGNNGSVHKGPITMQHCAYFAGSYCRVTLSGHLTLRDNDYMYYICTIGIAFSCQYLEFMSQFIFTNSFGLYFEFLN